jgi:hypothetical protein
MADFCPHNMTSNSVPSPYVARASSYYVTLPPYKAFNNSVSGSAYWVTNGTSTGYLQIDLGDGNTHKCASYAIQVNTVPEPNRAPKDFTLQGSNNDSNWDVLDTQTDQTSWGNGEKRTFSGLAGTTAYRYFKLNVTANNGDTYLQCGELYLYEPAYALDFAPHNMTSNSAPSPYEASASTNHALLPPYKAFDNNLSTLGYWATTGTDVGWLKIDLGETGGKALGSYGIQTNVIPENTRAPKDWTMQGSHNDSAWTTLDTVTDEIDWGIGETRFFTCDVSSEEFRYYKIDVTENNGGDVLAIGELFLLPPPNCLIKVYG